MVKDNKNIYQTKPAEGLRNYHAGNLAQAVKNCGEVLQKYPRNAEAMHLLGVAAIATEQYDGAVRLIKQAIVINPGNPVFYSDAGIALQRLNRP